MINPTDTISAHNYISTIREDGDHDYKDVVAPKKREKAYVKELSLTNNIYRKTEKNRCGDEARPLKKIGHLISDFLSVSISRGNLRAKSFL